MRFVSLFSGIEAASVAWEPLGWEAMAFAEIEPFPCAVLKHRFPDVPNLGDVTGIDWEEFKRDHGEPDLVCGGSPCQSFSIAGGREGLDGESRLMFEYIRAVRDLRPRWLLWENVPGVFSIDGGRAFGILIDALEELGYGLAWRTLDAQFFGVAQRRRRVFVVGHLGGGGGAAAVLFTTRATRPPCRRWSARPNARCTPCARGINAATAARYRIAFPCSADAAPAWPRSLTRVSEMAIQYKRHACEAKPRSVEVVQMQIDRRGLSWELVSRHTESAVRMEVRVYVEYCPFCGAKL